MLAEVLAQEIAQRARNPTTQEKAAPGEKTEVKQSGGAGAAANVTSRSLRGGEHLLTGVTEAGHSRRVSPTEGQHFCCQPSKISLTDRDSLRRIVPSVIVSHIVFFSSFCVKPKRRQPCPSNL